MKQRIQLSDHFTYGRLIRFTLPSIGMMICCHTKHFLFLRLRADMALLHF